MLYTVLKVNRHFCDLSPRKPLISKVLSTAKLFLQPARELYPKQPSQLQEIISKNKFFYLLPMEATGKCHLRVTRKKKTKLNHSHCGYPSVCNSWSCPSQLQLLHFSPLHQNMKSADLDFFWSKSHLGQRGSSELHPLCLTHPLSPRGATTATALAGMGHGAKARFDPRGSSHQG